VRVSREDGQPFQVAFSVNQMKFTEYENAAVEFNGIEARAGNFPA
jgi:hypothetical protein